MIEKYIAEDLYYMSENDLRKLYPEEIGIHYAYCNGSNFAYLCMMRESIRKDYPNITDSEITIYEIHPNESQRHARQITLWISIPIDDYFHLRNSGKIKIK